GGYAAYHGAPCHRPLPPVCRSNLAGGVMVAPDHAVRQALATVVPDALGCDLISAHVLQSLTIDDDTLSLALRFGYPCDTLLPLYRRQIEQALAPVLAGRTLQ